MSTEALSRREFRFPFPGAVVLSMLVVVIFAAAHCYYTFHSVHLLSVEQQISATRSMQMIRWMWAATVALAVFVGVTIWLRARLLLVLESEGLRLRRAHLFASKRELFLPYKQVQKVVVDSGGKTLRIEGSMDTYKLPLLHAVEPGGRRPKEKGSKHPLVIALAERGVSVR
ncbi:MAG: hypothetical protein CO108_13075 [Deltaproteobacteria bacterium CG_4_9_14_3_um_filter_63_12]|nr:MAG: hypothetical protein COW42_02990 [Deltaproteobacteria bacterium CG17_big_fil_post_rev_8_21_14_2_50_63_7]PJB41487.1 MAG: hypothetical protein CO108_13075 [Deltaproteobacteria bacterium CG_4_9_14_3_um_filter_63_12]